jgi:hypothetical protein
MPIYSVQGPDGRIYDVEGPAGASEADVLAFVAAHADELPSKRTGLGAALGKGIESTLSQMRTGLAGLVSPEEAAKAGLERGKEIGSKYDEQVSLDKVIQAYKERGILPAAGEVVSQIPAAIAEQLPNIGATLASGRAGAALGSMAGPVGTVVGGLTGAALPSLVQQFGGNIERQAEEGAPISRSAAGAAAVPQAALDVAGTFIPLGGRLVSKLTGIPERALLGDAAGKAAKLADERLATTLLKGTGTGLLAEIPTEVAQQMLERAQAGLSLTSPDALREYGETAYQVSLLSPMGTAGRLADRSAARGQISQEKEAERQRQMAEDMALEEQQRAAKQAAAKAGTGADLVQQMGMEDKGGLDLEGKIAAAREELATHEATLAQVRAVAPKLQARLEEAKTANNLPQIGVLSRQLAELEKAESLAEKGKAKALKVVPVEDPEILQTQLKTALEKNNYAKAAELSEQLQKVQALAPVEMPGKTQPTVQEDMFAPGWEQALTKKDIAEIEEGFGQPPARAEKPSKAEAQQTALFEQGQELEETLSEREIGKSMELTPEQYADALRRGYNPSELGTEPKVLYRQVQTAQGTKRVPYVVDVNGMARDLTEAEAAKLESAEPEATPETKLAVSEAIDSGLITPAVKKALGLSGLGRNVLDLSNGEDAAVAEAQLRKKLEEHKASSQGLLKRFVDDPLAENTLYDMQGRLTQEAKNIIQSDVQAQEIERLLNHVIEQQKGARTALRENMAAKELTKTLHRKEAIDTTLPPIEKLTAQDQSELNKALGLTGSADIKAAPQDKVSATRHRVEAKRQGTLRQEAYEDLLLRLDKIKEAGDKKLDPSDNKILQRLRARYVTAALKEAAHLRAADRRPGLTASEVMEASSELHTTLRELSDRYLAKAPTQEQIGTVEGMTYKPAVEGTPVEDTTVDEQGNVLYKEKYTELSPKGEKQQARITGKLKSAQEALTRAITTYNNHKTNFLDPAYAAYQATPSGPERKAADNKYQRIKKQSDANAQRVTDLTNNLVIALREAGKPKATVATIEQDLRDLSQRPFGKLAPALETIKEQLEGVTTRLIGKAPAAKRVAEQPIARAQGILDRIKKAEKDLEAVKGKHKSQAAQKRLRNYIDSLRNQYNALMEQKGEAPAAVTNFTERRDEMESLQASTKQLFEKGDYEAAAKGLERLRKLELDEADANVLGAELEENNRTLERAIKDTQKQLEELATGLKIEQPKEIKLGERTPPKVSLDAKQVAEYKRLTKQLDALERAYVNNKGAMESVGLYSGTVDTLTEDMFGTAPELGVVFETPEKFLGSAKYGKIAKLRKAANQTADVLPVSTAELYAARSDYVAATNVLGALRKLRTKSASVSEYFNLMSAEYLRQADAVKDRRESQSDVAKTGWEGRKWLENEEKRLRQLAKDAETRAQFFLHTLTEQQAATMQEFNEAAKEVDIATADGMVTAQAAVDRAKEKMDAVDARAEKNGVLAPVVETKAEPVTKTVDEKLQEKLAATYKEINELKKYAEDQPWDIKAAIEAEISGLYMEVRDIETEMFMRTAEGRIKRLTESFFEEFSDEYDPVNPLKNALGRAHARSQEYVPQSALVHVDRIEQLRKDRGEVIDAMAKLAKAEPPTNKQAFLDFNMDVADLQEKLEQIDTDIDELTDRIKQAQNAEVQMLMRADSAVKDAWAKLKAAEAAIKAGDKKAFEDMAKRKAALIETEKAIREAKEAARLEEANQKQRIAEGFGLPGVRVTKVAALSAEGEALGARNTGRTLQTMNPGWSVTYTDEGPQFSYDPAKDPDATEADKKRKSLTANKAYDQLKKARSAYNRALDSKNATAIAATKEKLSEKERLLEELAGARYIRVVEAIDANPTELDQDIAVHEAVAALPAKDRNAYFKARAEQENAKKQLEHIRSLKGETELSNMQKASRNIDEALKEAKAKLAQLEDDYQSDPRMTKSGYEKRKESLTTQIANIEKRKVDIQQQLGPREKTHEAKLQDATNAYFAAKKKADEFILPKKEKEAKAERAPATENLADLAQTVRTLSYQSKVGQDIKPVTKQNAGLRGASTEAKEARLRKAAEKLAKGDRLVTMYKKGSSEYNKALKETTDGYFNKLLDSDAEGGAGTVLRLEGSPPANPVDAQEAKAAADKFKAKLPKDVKFVYAPTLSQAPVKFLRALADDKIDVETSAVKGGVLPDGTIVVIGNMHTSLTDLEETFVHEAVGHYGVDVLLGPDGMQQLTKDVRTSEGGIVGMAKALGVEEDTVKTAMAYEQQARELEAAGDKEGAAKKRREGEIQAVREMLAHLAEKQVTESFVQKAARYIKVVLGAIRSALKKMGLLNTANLSTNDLYYTLFRASRRMQQEMAGMYKSPVGLLSLRGDRVAYANPGLAEAGAVTDQIIARDRNWYDSVKANGTGLAFETQVVDRFAGFERLAKYMEPLRGSQMMFYLRMYDQRMHHVAQAIEHGALQRVAKKRADGRTEYLIEAVDGPSIRGVANILKDAPAGSPEAANRLFTLYMSAIRARNKGVNVLNFSERITEADLQRAMRAIEATPGLKEKFELARKEYNAYNRNMIKFLSDTDAISDKLAAELVKEDDYIPWYRQRNGVVELVIGSESPIRIGNIAEQPYLQELVGGDKPILDFLTSSVQNTNMLVDMGMRNLATKNAMFELQSMGMATIGRKKQAGPNIVKFRIQPENEKDTGERYAYVEGTREIPGDLLVKGMEGIPTQLSGVMRLMGMPATFLRKAVTASPLYAAKQLFRDSVAAPLLSGADFTPVMGAIRQIGSPTKNVLERRGVTGGQIFTGTSEDLTRTLKRIVENKPGWFNSLAKWETIAMEADATTRRAQYNSYIKQGLSEMEATLMSLESMNFSKRGASPSMHVIGSLIPFFNAQIQGLNVLYKAMTGKMPFNERLRIQEKLYTRGMMLAASTLAYTAMMQDDEAYKNATPEQKYGNWFLRIPGVDEPVRLPVPFEIGYIFKALPEAIYNSAVNEHGSEEAVKAFTNILKMTIPGGSSYGVPQAIRPALEAFTGKSFYTGRDILSQHEKGLLPEAQYRETTSEVAKYFGSLTGQSPIVMEELVRGYTGPLGVALLQAVSMGIPKGDSPEKAYKRLSEMPLVGSAFQPNDAGGIIASTYDRMVELKKVEATVDDLISKGRRADAMELLEKRGNEYAAAELSDFYTSNMRELTSYENAIRASSMTPQEKRAALDNVRQIKIYLANTVRGAADRTKLP